MSEVKHMKAAIAAARKSVPEDDGRIHPKVGVTIVTVRGDVVTSFRGELGNGDHAEYTALEKKLQSETLTGAVVYTTLEPCTSRNHPKVPCADRLIDRKVERVFVGMLDPNPIISGKGVQRLREANIDVAMFPKDLAAQVEELNRDFIRDQKRQGELPEVSPARLRESQGYALDTWYTNLNRTFWNQNYHREPSSIFAHLVEVVGGLSALASNKRKPGVDPTTNIAKALAWWLTLCGKLGIRSVEEMLWDKFPNVCPYCQKSPHEQDHCSHAKAKGGGPPWDVLEQLGSNGERPSRLRDWQRMFSRIYPVGQTESYGPSFARLTEELGELSEAIRVFRAEPGYVLSEAADVFAWLMHIQNITDTNNNVTPNERGSALEKLVAESYPDGCVECGKKVCACPAILPKTIGRIAHEVPPGRSHFGKDGRFMSPDKASKFFQENM